MAQGKLVIDINLDPLEARMTELVERLEQLMAVPQRTLVVNNDGHVRQFAAAGMVNAGDNTEQAVGPPVVTHVVLLTTAHTVPQDRVYGYTSQDAANAKMRELKTKHPDWTVKVRSIRRVDE